MNKPKYYQILILNILKDTKEGIKESTIFCHNDMNKNWRKQIIWAVSSELDDIIKKFNFNNCEYKRILENNY